MLKDSVVGGREEFGGRLRQLSCRRNSNSCIVRIDGRCDVFTRDAECQSWFFRYSLIDFCDKNRMMSWLERVQLGRGWYEENREHGYPTTAFER